MYINNEKLNIEADYYIPSLKYDIETLGNKKKNKKKFLTENKEILYEKEESLYSNNITQCKYNT